MSHYGISIIKLNNTGTEAEEVKIHKLSRDAGKQDIGVDDGRVMAYDDVANLLVAGDTVHVLIDDGPGRYRLADKVRIKPGLQREFLESVDENDVPTTALLSLPTYQ